MTATAAPVRQAPPTRELIIDRCVPKKSGPRKDGRGQWTIYDVHARTPQGELVAQRLKAWDLLPLGLPARRYEVERDVFTPDDGPEVVSYVLRLPKPSAQELRLMIDELYATVTELDRRIGALERTDAPQAPTDDEDIPF